MSAAARSGSADLGAIVLAGGRSSRFGRDKLAEPLDGRPLLWHAIDAVRPLTGHIVVALAPDAHHELPPGVEIARDETAFDGPLAGLATGLAAVTTDLAIVVAGDMPTVVPGILARLVDALADPGVDAAVLGTIDPSLDPGRPIPLAIRCEPARAAVAELLAGGERRLRALPERLDAVRIPEAVWRADDPAAASLRDIDRPADLDPDR